MRALSTWLGEYSESHRNRTNRLLHKVCVPAIAFTVVGFLELLPPHFGFLSLGRLVILAALIWYFVLSRRAFFLMVAFFLVSELLFHLLAQRTPPFWPLVGIFVVAWIGQFIGHGIEGKRPSFFKDLQFLLIGPLWVFQAK